MPHSLTKAAFLRQTDARQLVLLFDFLPEVSFFIKDREGRFMAVNRRFCEYCGVQYEHEVIGQTDREFFPKSRADKYRKDDATVMRTGRGIINRVENAPEHEGSPHLVSVTKLPLRDAKGKIIGVVGFGRALEQIRERSANAVRLAKVVEAMHRHPEAGHSTAELARMVGLSGSHFDRCFRATFGTSARQYLLRARVEAACRRLAESNDTVTTIALECGFYDHAHLAHSFRQVMNTAPVTYRRAHQMPPEK